MSRTWRSNDPVSRLSWRSSPGHAGMTRSAASVMLVEQLREDATQFFLLPLRTGCVERRRETVGARGVNTANRSRRGGEP
jgi:hypothetical protein